MFFSTLYQKHYTETIRLAYPIVIGQLSTIIIMITDNVVVGNFSADSLAAASISHAIFMTLQIFGMGVTFGITPLVASAVATQDHDLCRKLFKHGIITYTAFSVILSMVVLLITQFIDHFGQPPHIVTLAKPFLQLVGFSIIPALIFQTFKQFMEGLSQTKEPMYVAIVGEILNAILNVVLVFGFLGFPRLGLIGSGIATLTARIFMVLFITYIFFNRQKFSRYAQGLQAQLLEAEWFIKLLKIGLPIGMQMIFESSAFAFSAIMAGWVADNGKTLAAHQIALNIASTTYLTASGISMATAIRTANYKGLKDVEGMQMAGKSGIVIAVVFMFICALAMVLGNTFLPSLYVQDTQVIAIAANLLLVAALFQLSDGVQVVTMGALRGLQDVRMPTFITFVAYWGIGLPLSAFLMFYMEWGGVGIWASLAFALSVAAILLTRRFFKLSAQVAREN
jgi:MATE family multidrug resistance protein